MCLLITAATYGISRTCLFVQLHIFIYIFLRDSSMHIGMDTLVKDHNQYLNISMCWLFVLWHFLCVVGLIQNKHAKQTANSCQALRVSGARSVSTAYKPCSSVHAHDAESTSQQPDCTATTPSLTDDGIAASQIRGLHMKAFSILMCKVRDLFYSRVCV